MVYKIKTLNDLDQSINQLIGILNHRVTKLEVSTKWIKWILGYISIIMTGIFVVVIGASL